MPNKIRIKQFVSLLPGFILSLILILLSKTLSGSSRAAEGDTRKKILIVRLDAIGDFILWLDAAKELRRLFPKGTYSITLLGNSIWSDLAIRLQYFDEVWPADRNTLVCNSVSFVSLVRKLSSTNFDIVLHPVSSREFLFGDFFVWASAGKEKIGMDGDLLNECWWLKILADRFYTRLVPGYESYETELGKNALFMRGIGMTGYKTRVPIIDKRVGSSFPLPYADYYVVFPGASVAARRWPVANFASLIETIKTVSGLPAVICGGRSEKGLGDTLEKRVSGTVLNLVGKTSLCELVSVIAGARFLICNETGAVHIAAALGTPSVCILGGGHFGRFLPYGTETEHSRCLPLPVFNRMTCFGCNWKCVHRVVLDEAFMCVENVSVGEVFSAVKTLGDLHLAH